jgi:tetratricopeptide (TPR) repeat protein
LLDGRLAEGAEWVTSVFAVPGADSPTLTRVWALAAAGGIAYWAGDQETAVRSYEAQHDLATSLDDAAGLADAAFNLASASFVRGDLPRSLAYAEEARGRYQALGDLIGINRIEWAMITVTRVAEPRDAIPDLERVLRRAEVLGDTPYVAIAAGTLAWIAFALGDALAAGLWAMRSMREYYAIRDVASTTISLPVGALMALAAGRPQEAATIMGAFQALCERYGVRPPLGLGAFIQNADPLGQARAALGPEEFATAVERGRRMTLAEAMELIAEVGDAVSTPPASGSPPRSSPG